MITSSYQNSPNPSPAFGSELASYLCFPILQSGSNLYDQGHLNQGTPPLCFSVSTVTFPRRRGPSPMGDWGLSDFPNTEQAGLWSKSLRSGVVRLLQDRVGRSLVNVNMEGPSEIHHKSHFNKKKISM